MNDPRALRREVETWQSELRAERELLAIPVDVAAVNREVGQRLAALATERDALTAAIRGIGGLTGAVAHTRFWLMAKKLEQPRADLRGAFELLAVLTLGAAYIWCGVIAGGWLERNFVPWQLALGLCVFGAVLICAKLVGIARWLKTGGQCDPPRDEEVPAVVPMKARGRRREASILVLSLIFAIGLSAYYGIGQYVAKREQAARRHSPASDQHRVAVPFAEETVLERP